MLFQHYAVCCAYDGKRTESRSEDLRSEKTERPKIGRIDRSLKFEGSRLAGRSYLNPESVSLRLVEELKVS